MNQRATITTQNSKFLDTLLFAQDGDSFVLPMTALLPTPTIHRQKAVDGYPLSELP